jgi:molybdate transport system substrate-binding protein
MGSCRDGERERSLTIAAAADLRSALTEMRPAIEQAVGGEVTILFGSSGLLKEQILAGAPYGLYMSSDRAFVEELRAAGRVAEDGHALYAVGRLALVWRQGIAPLSGTGDLAREDLRRITIANPSHAPYGRAAREAMERAGIWAALQPRIVLGENVRQATDYVESGNVDAGIVALALVIGTEVPHIVVDASEHAPLLQGAAVVAGSGQEQSARRALAQILGEEGQALLRRYGFEAIPEP